MPRAGTFQSAGLNTVFNFTTVSGTFLITGGVGAVGTVGNTDTVIVQGTNSRDLFQIDQGARTVQVFAYNVNPLKTVLLDPTIQVLSALGLLGQDTFQVVPAAGVPAFTGDGSGINNLLVNVDGGSDASGENNALVIQGAGGVALPATSFVVVNRGADYTSGTVRVFQSAAADPDINYVNVQVVSPNVSNAPAGKLNAGQPNLLIMGPDLNEPNEYQANAAFVGSGATLQIQHASIFPNFKEFPGVPSDNDYYRVVAQTTGTLDFQVYFKLFDPALLPAGGNLNLKCWTRPATSSPRRRARFRHGRRHGERPRPHSGRGRTELLLHVFGQPTGTEGPSAVVNGYDVTIIDTPDRCPTDLELSRSVPRAGGRQPRHRRLAGQRPGRRYRAVAVRQRHQGQQPDHLSAAGRRHLPAGLAGQPDGGRRAADGTDPDPVQPRPPTIWHAGRTAGFRIAVYDGGNGLPAAGNPHTLDPNDSTFIGFAQPVAGVPHLYALTIGSQGADSLADGLHHLTARVQIIDPANPTQTGFGDRSVSLDITVDTVVPPAYFGLISLADTTQGLDGASDSGVLGNPNLPATFTDRVTNDKTPTLLRRRRGECHRPRLCGHQRRAGPPDDRRQPRHVPGRNGGGALGRHEPVPQRRVEIHRNPRPERSALGLGIDGVRTFFVTGEDLAGNVTPDANADSLQIFLDTQGPQITNVQDHRLAEPYNLFGLKPDNALQGPTPLVNSLVISVQDLPPRVAEFLYNALAADATLGYPATDPGNYLLVGDANGVIDHS